MINLLYEMTLATEAGLWVDCLDNLLKDAPQLAAHRSLRLYDVASADIRQRKACMDYAYRLRQTCSDPSKARPDPSEIENIGKIADAVDEMVKLGSTSKRDPATKGAIVTALVNFYLQLAYHNQNSVYHWAVQELYGNAAAFKEALKPINEAVGNDLTAVGSDVAEVVGVILKAREKALNDHISKHFFPPGVGRPGMLRRMKRSIAGPLFTAGVEKQPKPFYEQALDRIKEFEMFK